MRPININFITITEQSSKKTVVLLLILLIYSVYLIGDNIYIFYVQKRDIEHYNRKIKHYSSENTTDKRTRTSEEIKTKSYKKFSAAEIEDIKADVSFLNKLLQYKSFPWIDILDKLELSIDNGVLFTQIDIDRESKQILLKGNADSAENLSLFIKTISSERLFVLNSLSQESKQSGVINFDMGLQIR
ncbi:MAG: PilN domain-containing protein [Desulfamplus sp.]|nr:PilN domain-containing protein [Desulfamplus sp.]